MAGALFLSLVWQNALSGMGRGSLLASPTGTIVGVKEGGYKEVVRVKQNLASVPQH